RLHFSFQSHRTHPDLHSFPTRRSSDLSFLLPAPPKPSPDSRLTYRAIDQGSSGAAPRPTLTREGDAVRVTFSLHSQRGQDLTMADRKSTRLNSSHVEISYAVFCLKKKI